MGKCTKRGKDSGVLAVMEVNNGVRTRAKALALHSLGRSPSEYLQLRSRRLEKLPPAILVESSQIYDRFSGGGDCTVSDDDDDDRSVNFREGDSGSEGIIRNNNTIKRREGRRRMPSKREMEEFFQEAERKQKWAEQIHLLSKKYNFNFLNGVPFNGRYQWINKCPSYLNPPLY